MALRLNQSVGIDPCVDEVFAELWTEGGRARHRGHGCERQHLPARDAAQAHRALAQRMLYLWARRYAEQLGEAASYVSEVDERFVLHDDARLAILQLSRRAGERESGASGLAASPLGAWSWFLTEAAEWRQVPAAIDTPIREEAMGVLNEFRTDVHKNELYRAQLDAERVAATVREEMEETAERSAEALVENARVLAEKEQVRAEKEVALAELARLSKKLADSEA